VNLYTVRRLQIALKRSVGRKDFLSSFVAGGASAKEAGERARARGRRIEPQACTLAAVCDRIGVLLVVRNAVSIAICSREIQVSFKKKPSDNRVFCLCLCLSLGGGESGSLFSEEEQRRRVFGLLLKTGSSYLFVWIVVRRKRRTRKKTKTRKEFIHCRCLVPLVGGKPGDFETCQEEVCFVCPLSLCFFFGLLFNLESVFFFLFLCFVLPLW
jgi:hypothetical protein